LLALLLFSPVILWNARHEWASFTFQTAGRLAQTPRFSLHQLLASALVLLTPPGFLAVWPALRGPTQEAPRAGTPARRWRFLRVCIAVPLAVFIAFSLRHEVKLDWTGPVWLAAVPALAIGIVVAAEQRLIGMRAWIMAIWPYTLIILLLTYGAALRYLAGGLAGLGYSDHMELIPVGWRQLGQQVAQLQAAIGKSSGSEPLVIGMDRYATASELAFYAPDHSRSVISTSSSHFFGGAGLMYERWFPLTQSAGRTLLLVGLEPQKVLGEEIDSHIARSDPPRQGTLTRNGQVIHHYYYRVVYGYRP
jgi:dolichol-phosphate mannosyltransferase